MLELIVVMLVAYVVLATIWLGVVLPAWEAWRRRP